MLIGNLTESLTQGSTIFYVCNGAQRKKGHCTRIPPCGPVKLQNEGMTRLKNI